MSVFSDTDGELLKLAHTLADAEKLYRELYENEGRQTVEPWVQGLRDRRANVIERLADNLRTKAAQLRMGREEPPTPDAPAEKEAPRLDPAALARQTVAAMAEARRHYPRTEAE